MANPATCNCICETTDSTLSVVANVISCATLGYVVLVGMLYQFAIQQRSRSSSDELRGEAVLLRLQLNNIQERYEQTNIALDQNTNPSVKQYPYELSDLYDWFNRTTKELAATERDLALMFPSEAHSAKWYFLLQHLRSVGRKASMEKRLYDMRTRVSIFQRWM